MLSIGIVGLPNVGKSTLFQALTRISVPIATYPFTTIEPHVGVVAVPDERLEKLRQILKPEKTVPATIEFVDIAGLVKGAAEGQGLGNQFLSRIYSVDAILFLLRAFGDSNIPVPVDNPAEQLTILRDELRKKDEEIRERARAKKQESEPTPLGRPAGLALLSEKPAIVVCNVRGEAAQGGNHSNIPKNIGREWTGCELMLDCKLELEMAEMKPEEVAELELQSKLGQLINRAYDALGLITFYTIKGGQELHAWPIRRGTIAPEAGGAVHSDFQEKFIRAEIIPYSKLLECGSWAKARELGWVRTEGREYIVQDGDIIEFKI